MKISLLTQEFSQIRRFTKETGRLVSYVKYKLVGNKYKAWSCIFPTGGHRDVVDSFLKGAEAFSEVEILVNPTRSQIRGTIVYVPSDWRALRDAIVMKRGGEIKKLIAGPTVCDLPQQYGGILCDPDVDVCIVPSEWVRKMFLAEFSAAARRMNIRVCPSGVDQEQWCAHRSRPDDDFRRALVYVKRTGAEKEREVFMLLRSHDKQVQTIVCGSYVPDEYREKLEWCDFVVVLGESETQGLTMLQAWSMNRQTLVYDTPNVCGYHKSGKKTAERLASPCPYLSEHTGAFWKDTAGLADELQHMKPRAPRAWVLENQTNEVRFAHFLEIINAEPPLARFTPDCRL